MWVYKNGQEDGWFYYLSIIDTAKSCNQRNLDKILIRVGKVLLFARHDCFVKPANDKIGNYHTNLGRSRHKISVLICV
jgi:hypothetical protein